MIGKRLLVWAAGAAVVLTLAGLSALVTAAGAPAPGGSDRATSAGLPPAPLGSVTPCPLTYTYTVSSGVVVTSTNLVPGSQCGHCIVPLAFPFPVSLYGQSYTAANIANYGLLQFATADTSLQSCLPYPAIGPAVMPYWYDGVDTSWNEPCQGSYGLPCGVFTSTTGVAPNRIFNIEWRSRLLGSNHETMDYETRFYENSSTIDFVYGFGAMFGFSTTSGVQDGASRFTTFICNTTGNYQFLTVRWTEEIPPSCEPTYTPSPSPTRTSTVPPSSTSTVPPTRTSTVPPTSTSTVPPSSTATPAPPTETVPPSATAAPSATPTSAATATPGAAPTRTSAPAPTATPCAGAFSDVFPADYYYAPVAYLYCHGVISGYSDGTFRPAGFTTRGQMTKIVVLGFGLPIWTPAPPAPATFSDVPHADPFFAYIETAAHYGIVSGYQDGSFHPAANVARGQLAKMVVAAAERVSGWPLLDPPAATFSDVPRGSAFYPFVETAVCHGVISGYADGAFRPGNSATRGQIAKIAYLAVLNGGSCAGR